MPIAGHECIRIISPIACRLLRYPDPPYCHRQDIKSLPPSILLGRQFVVLYHAPPLPWLVTLSHLWCDREDTRLTRAECSIWRAELIDKLPWLTASWLVEDIDGFFRKGLPTGTNLWTSNLMWVVKGDPDSKHKTANTRSRLWSQFSAALWYQWTDKD